MAKTPYLTTPPKITTMPPGVPYIVGNEAAERFSYYGMNSILTIFMTKYLLDRMGHLSTMPPANAEAWYHTFVSTLYFLPIFGAVLADAVFGKFWVVFWISIVYCAGHAMLALIGTPIAHTIEPRYLLAIGLILIAIGAGGIKPCVSTNVGDQFGESNKHLLTRVFNWFYFSINAGSFISTLLIPWLLEPYQADPNGFIARLGPSVVGFLQSPRLHSADIAFGLPGVFMAIATLVFWLGRKKFVHIPPVGLKTYAREIFNKQTGKIILNVLMPVPFVMIFWALWQQNFSSWIIQAESMDRHLFGIEWLSSQIQTVNPIFILIMLPVFSYWLYPFLEKFVRLTPLRKIGAGLFVTAASFFIVAMIQTRIDAGARPSIIWQVWAFVVLTAGETLVSPTHLEFSYTQGPVKLKSLIMCTYLLAISLGNQFTAAVNFFIQNPDGSVKLQGASYFMFFVWVMLGTAVLFTIVSPFYKGRTYLQDQTRVTGDAEPGVGFAVQPEA
ncbi:MAG TPA: POT family MFS transporter [Chthoniobacterales bacterium]|nr:POT family MFS transporter [Chthoniobacterales bacterium]